jgi:hypothetical protein
VFLIARSAFTPQVALLLQFTIPVYRRQCLPHNNEVSLSSGYNRRVLVRTLLLAAVQFAHQGKNNSARLAGLI